MVFRWGAFGERDGQYPFFATETGVYSVQVYRNCTSLISDTVHIIVIEKVLPITKLEFELKPANNGIEIDCSTSSELNSKGFELYRSEPIGTEFKKISFSESRSSYDHLNLEYHFSDLDVLRNIKYYYQIRQIDYDGHLDL